MQHVFLTSPDKTIALLDQLRMSSCKLYIRKKNADPCGRVRSADELRGVCEHSVKQQQTEELIAPERWFVELKNLPAHMPKPDPQTLSQRPSGVSKCQE